MDSLSSIDHFVKKIFEWQNASFVGAMKIARPLTVSDRHVEWHPPIPGSLSEGAVERMRD